MSSLTENDSGKVIQGPPELPIPEHHSAGQYFYDRLTEGGDKIALIDGRTGTHVTYRQVLQGAVNVALTLEKWGVGRGDLVLICSDNGFEVSYAIVGVLFTGATVAMANIGSSHDELMHAMSVAKPKVVLCSAEASRRILGVTAKLTCVRTVLTLDVQTVECKQISSFLATGADAIRYRPHDVAGVRSSPSCCTPREQLACPREYSGPTLVSFFSWQNHSMLLGILLLTTTVIVRNIDIVGTSILYYVRNIARTEYTPTALMVISWSQAFGFVSMLSMLTNHYRVVFFPRFKEEPFFKAIDLYKVNLVFLVPALMTLLTQSTFADHYDISSVRQIWSSSSVLSKQLEEATCKRFGVPYVRHIYGSTESGYITLPDDGAFRHGSVGRLAVGVTVKVINPKTGAAVGVGEPGELLMRSRKNMIGYRDNPAATRASFDSDGFLHTGDIVSYDEDMYFYIVDRIKELIKYKGFQVPPNEVEQALLSHPAVLECGVVGLPDEVAGELPLAFVVLRSDVTATEVELQDFVATKVSSPKRLRGGVRFVSSLPRNPTGKLLRRKLREMISAESHF